MNHRKFNATQIPGGRLEISTPLGKRVAEGERDAERICNEIEAAMTQRLGRAPTRDECLFGPKVIGDDRTLDQKMERESWKPKRTDTPHPADTLADKLDVPDDPYYGIQDRNKRLAAGLRNIAERDRGSAEADSHQQEKLSRLKHDLAKIDTAISDENWRAERGSRRILDVLTMLRSQLVDGSDSAETRRLRAEYMRLTGERAKVEQAANKAARDALLAQAASISDGSKLGNVGEADPVRYRAEQLMADGADPTSAWTQARSEAKQE